MKQRVKRSIITEPVTIITGSQGSAKTLFAIAQAHALVVHGDAKRVFQLGINEPDLRKLPALPFPLNEWHKPEHAELVEGAVIIVDEFHERLPQRGPGRPPEFVEQMAQVRKRGVRFIFITQSVEFDHFLKGSRCNRHLHLERKLGVKASTIHEWQNRFVSRPIEDKDARKEAIRHVWRHDKRYFDWYVSAASHHFRVRIPLRLFLVPVFLLAVVWFIYKAAGTLGPMLSGTSPGAQAITGASSHLQPPPITHSASEQEANRLPVTSDSLAYLEQFKPLVPAMPWSAPAFQGRELLAEPDIYCMGAGDYGLGECHCYTEQVTPVDIDHDRCWKIARHGIYNPHRPSLRTLAERGGEADGKAQTVPRPSDAAPMASVLIPDETGLSSAAPVVN